MDTVMSSRALGGRVGSIGLPPWNCLERIKRQQHTQFCYYNNKKNNYRGRRRGSLLFSTVHPLKRNVLSSSSAIDRNNSIRSSSSSRDMEVSEIRERCRTWKWKGQYSINYFVHHHLDSSTPPLLLIHGFGASIPHWRRNINTLAQEYTVYAIDLIGFGASDKPCGFSYSMETWAQLIMDFIMEVIERPSVLIGNSVGSLACVIAACESDNLVRGLVLLNCAGGMNNKAIVDDWRIKLLLPLLLFFDLLLQLRPIASAIFNRVKQRDTLRNVLLSVYGNKDSVDDQLVEIIMEPTNDEGALDAFVSIVTGPPGPNPVKMMPRISSNVPVLVLWGDQDPFTPLDGPVGKYFSSLPSQFSNVTLQVLQGVGHCPHDDRPELVHQNLLPWLTNNLP